MSNELDFSTGEAAMAFTGDTPWHGLGKTLEKGASIEEWAAAAKMEWEIFRTPVKFDVVRDKPLSEVESSLGISALTETLIYPEKHVLYRSDTNSPLSIVSPSYNIVQPIEVLEFYRDLVGTAGLELETAGVLFGGRRFWALANTGKTVELAGQTVKRKWVDIDPRTKNEVEYEEEINVPDTVKGYLLLTTSCDGTLATTAQFTSVRVVCNNTLSIATRDNNSKIRVPHNRIWNPNEVKEQLGFIDKGWSQFAEQVGLLGSKVAPRDKAVQYLVTLFGDLEVVEGHPKTEEHLERYQSQKEDWWQETIANQSPAVKQKCADVWNLYTGEGMGSKMKSADGTWWGLLNAITETMDYHTSHRTTDARLNNTWYGAGAALKTKAFELALELANE